MLDHAVLEQETLPDDGNISGSDEKKVDETGRRIDISEIRARCLYHVFVSRECMQLLNLVYSRSNLKD